jgi:chromosome segregation ATPase
VPVNVAALEASLELEARQFHQAIGKAERELDNLEGGARKTTTGFGGLKGSVMGLGAVLGGGFAVQKAIRFMDSAVTAASDLHESVGAVGVVFGDSADKILRFGETAAETAGLSKREVNEAAKVMGSALQNAGFSAEDAAQKTVDLTQRAADMASLMGGPVSGALDAIQAALRGEIDPIERFGVSMSAATVEAKALELGLADTKREITETDKATARLAIIMDQTAQAEGDFARTGDDLAQQLKKLNAELENQKAALGEDLIGPKLALVKATRDLVQIMTGEVEASRALRGAYKTLGDDSKFLTDQTTRLEEAEKDQAREAGLARMELEDWAFSARQAERDAGTFEEAIRETVEPLTAMENKLRAAERAQRDLANELLAASDPVFAAVSAIQSYESALASANEDQKLTDAEAVELTEAWLRMQASVEQVDAANINSFASAAGAALGLSAQQVDTLLRELGLLDAMTVDVPINVRKTGISSISVAALPGWAGTKFGVFAFHHGGVVPGEPSDLVPALLKGGETVLPTGQPGFDGMGGEFVNHIVVELDGRVLDERWVKSASRADARGRVPRWRAR